MAQYSNGFTIATKEDFSEVIIGFTQTLPTVDSSGKVTSTTSEPVTTLILNRSTASALLSHLAKLFQDGPQDS